MARLRLNNLAGTTGASLGASSSGTSQAITGLFAVAPAFATLVAPDYYVVIFEPNTANYEISYLTNYTAGSLDGTVTRGQEGTGAPAHPFGTSGVPWQHGSTAQDFAPTYKPVAFFLS
jgi:hypothetical protein